MHMSHRARGEGSIYQRKDGRWVAAVSLENGKRKQIYRHTKPEAVLALQLANQAKLQGTLTSTRDETVEVFLRDWLQFSNVYRLCWQRFPCRAIAPVNIGAIAHWFAQQ